MHRMMLSTSVSTAATASTPPIPRSKSKSCGWPSEFANELTLPPLFDLRNHLLNPRACKVFLWSTDAARNPDAEVQAAALGPSRLSHLHAPVPSTGAA